jgi:hypothetical protein
MGEIARIAKIAGIAGIEKTCVATAMMRTKGER